MGNENNKILQKIITVLDVLNNISVSGKANLANLSGSIAMLEDVAGVINAAQTVEKDKHDNKT